MVMYSVFKHADRVAAVILYIIAYHHGYQVLHLVFLYFKRKRLLQSLLVEITP